MTRIGKGIGEIRNPRATGKRPDLVRQNGAMQLGLCRLGRSFGGKYFVHLQIFTTDLQTPFSAREFSDPHVSPLVQNRVQLHTTPGNPQSVCNLVQFS